jgi:galactose-1-phosphate uridylyltransferase
MGIEFKSTISQTRFLDPRQGFQEARVESELRIDPLTGASSRICHFARLKFRESNLAALAEESQPGCPFCPEALEQRTPRFPPDIISEGKIVQGEAIVIPNLFPYDAYSAVTIMTRSHFLPLSCFSAELLLNAFESSLQFVHRIQDKEAGKVLYPFIFWNFSPPSGSSQLHPHLQIMLSEKAGNQVESLLLASQEYLEKWGRNYWAELAEVEEQRSERYLGRLGSTIWLIPFAPTGVLGDVIAIFEGKSHLGQLGKEELTQLVAGLQKVFRYLEDRNIPGFNLAFYSGLPDQEYMWVQVKLTPRVFLHPRLNTADSNALTILYGEPFSLLRPEEMGRQLRSYFEAQ